ncbi:unnamed protein product [Diabrotica balteata]|uniref:Uncharacterized protein n=1 Tax=Diabrotica balteata TaxID=107213 RepID=A0A9N9SSA8_DIABA|nr:unnamed protein product [Diabrotica balteata]
MAGECDPFSHDEVPTIVFYGKGKTEVDVTLVQEEEALAALIYDCSDIEDDGDPDYEETDMSTSDEDEVTLEKKKFLKRLKKWKNKKLSGRLEKLYIQMVFLID